MEKIFEINLLLDFYGQFITKRQFEIMDYYYNHDCSLKEISEHINISRQGVHDGLKKSKIALLEIEEKLGLVKKHREASVKIQEILDLVSSIKDSIDDPNIMNQLDQLKESIKNIMV
jgi:predicted DNA-binding protein YlxM (UPF0122 family)